MVHVPVSKDQLTKTETTLSMGAQSKSAVSATAGSQRKDEALGPKSRSLPELQTLAASEIIDKLFLDRVSLEALVEIKISRFFDQLDSHYPDELYDLIIRKVEKVLLHQILRRTGYNQAQASKLLGINRNTLRKKMKEYDLG